MGESLGRITFSPDCSSFLSSSLTARPFRDHSHDEGNDGSISRLVSLSQWQGRKERTIATAKMSDDFENREILFCFPSQLWASLPLYTHTHTHTHTHTEEKRQGSKCRLWRVLERGAVAGLSFSKMFHHSNVPHSKGCPYDVTVAVFPKTGGVYVPSLCVWTD